MGPGTGIDEALYELTGAGLIACASGLGLVVPPGSVRSGDAFVGFLSQRGTWGEINRIVEELKREALVAAAAAMTSPAGLVQQIREAVTMLETQRPDESLLRLALMGTGTGVRPDDGGPDAYLIAPATRLAAQMIARAAAAFPAPMAPAPGPSRGAQALLHRLLAALLRDPDLLVGLGPALQEFLSLTALPASVAPTPTPVPLVPARSQPAAVLDPRRSQVASSGADALQPTAACQVPPQAADRAPRPLAQLDSASEKLIQRYGIGQPFAAGLAVMGLAPLLERIQASHELTAGACARLLRTLESQVCPPGAVPVRLDEMASWLKGLIATLEKPSNDDSDTRRLKTEAAKTLAEGDLEAALRLLKQVRRGAREGRRRIEDRLREDLLLLNQQMTTEAGIIARQAETELTRRDYAAAAELFAEARDSLPRSELQAVWLYGMRQGEALFRLGDEFDDTQALREAVRAYGASLAMTGREEMPRNWVAAQCGLALAHLRLSEREADAAPLRAAIVAWREALAVLATLDEPDQTLVSRRHLARALVLLGEREREPGAVTAALGEAASLYRTLILAIARQRSPLDWAEAQLGLAGALLSLCERTGGEPITELLEAAGAAESAATIYGREQTPAEWSLAHLYLGNALLALGERERSVPRLRDAARCFAQALQGQSRTTAPRQWASIKLSEANALAAVAEESAVAGDLEEAATAYREALGELGGAEQASRRAIAELNLGTVLVRLAEHREPQRHRVEAMSVMLSALQTFEAEGATAYVEIAQANLRSLHRIVGAGVQPVGRTG